MTHRHAAVWLGLIGDIAVPDAACSATAAVLSTLAVQDQEGQLVVTTTAAQIQSLIADKGRTPRIHRGHIAQALDRLDRADWIQLVEHKAGVPGGRINGDVATTYRLTIPAAVIQP